MPSIWDLPQQEPQRGPAMDEARRSELEKQIRDLVEAFEVVWNSANRNEWDGKAIEHFGALLNKQTPEQHNDHG